MVFIVRWNSPINVPQCLWFCRTNWQIMVFTSVLLHSLGLECGEPYIGAQCSILGWTYWGYETSSVIIGDVDINLKSINSINFSCTPWQLLSVGVISFCKWLLYYQAKACSFSHYSFFLRQGKVGPVRHTIRISGKLLFLFILNTSGIYLCQWYFSLVDLFNT